MDGRFIGLSSDGVARYQSFDCDRKCQVGEWEVIGDGNIQHKKSRPRSCLFLLCTVGGVEWGGVRVTGREKGCGVDI